MKNKTILTSLIFAIAASANSGKFDQPPKNTLEAINNNNAPVVINSVPNSMVTLDFGLLTGESWDGANDPDNILVDCLTGGSVTGFEWTNVTIESVGASWLSEATLQFTDSAVTNGINLGLGNGDDFGGMMTYSSGGILDLTDAMLSDIVPGVDGIIRLQFFEGFDDVAGAIDANYTSGTIDVHGIDLVATPGPGCGFVAGADADLALVVTNDAMGVLDTGDTVIFTMTLDNNGPSAVTGAVVTSTLSDGLDYVSDDCAALVVGQDATWSVGALANGATTACNITTSVSGFGGLSLDATVTADQADPTPANNVGVSGINGPARIIPTLGQLGLILMVLALFYVGRRKLV